MFNHESPLRGETFVTRKITRALTRIKLGLQEKLFLGNLDALRDWGHARDYVEMQWLMLQQDKPKDYVISTGRTETVRKFVELSANKLGWGRKNNGEGIIWEGEGIDEVGKRADNGQTIIKIDKRYFRPCEVDSLIGDSSKANIKLGWEPSVKLEELIKEMVANDKEIALKKSLLFKSGFKVNMTNKE